MTPRRSKTQPTDEPQQPDTLAAEAAEHERARPAATTPRRRRRRTATTPSAEEGAAEGAPGGEAKPTRRRKTSRKTAGASAAKSEEAEPAAGAPRRRRTRRTEEAATEEPEAKQDGKAAAETVVTRRRRRRRLSPEPPSTSEPRRARAERPEEEEAERPSRTRGGHRRTRAAAVPTRREEAPAPTGRRGRKAANRGRAGESSRRTPRPARRTATEPQLEEVVPQPQKARVKRELIASVNPRESRIALLEDGKLMELFIDRPDTPNLVGSIILGRVDSIVPGIEAAFVDIGLQRNGFLYVQDIIGAPGDYDILDSLEQEARPRRYQRHHISKLLKKDQTVVVQVKKEPMGGKGTRLTSYITLPGRYCVLMPNVAQVGVSRKVRDDKVRDRLRRLVRRIRPQGMGLILRTAAEEGRDEDIEADLDHLLALWDRIQALQKKSKPPTVLHRDMTGIMRVARDIFTPEVSELVIDNRSAYDAVCSYLGHVAPAMVERVAYHDDETPLFEKFHLDEEIDRALQNRVPLPSGGYLLIDQTEAVVTIDVNTGSYTGSKRLEETVYATNLEAAGEVARQLRLRDLGGIILIDFIDMESKAYRRDVFQKLLEALRRDRNKTRVQDMSELCIVQLTRKRTKYSLLKSLCSPCPMCSGKGMLLSPITQALHILREIEMKTRHMEVEHVLVEAHSMIVDFMSHEFAHELADLEEHIERLILFHPVEDRGPEFTNVIVEGKPLKPEESQARRRRRGTRSGRRRRGRAADAPVESVTAETE